MQKTVLVIHGGTTFDTYEEYWKWLESIDMKIERIDSRDWKDFLEDKLVDFKIICPKMPNKMNAKYSEWKLWFEKMFHFLPDGVVLVGQSLGGYFSQSICQKIFSRKRYQGFIWCVLFMIQKSL